ncbi:hypothetical protein ACQZ4F_32435, partial [Pseudomonas aeruginosa]|uniref:hypothetical protein n=2 Tax=Pseudomonas aeruginosa TaxID=287 RepID=UPI0019D22A7F
QFFIGKAAEDGARTITRRSTGPPATQITRAKFAGQIRDDTYLRIATVGWSLSMVERRTVSFQRPWVKESELLERLGAERYGQLWPKALYGEGFWGRASRGVLLREPEVRFFAFRPRLS